MQAVIVTTPVNILRQITFIPVIKDEATKDALRKNIQAIEDIYTGPATKIILQTKSRFWENKLTYNIQGGFSKTNLPIGQIHYVRPDPEYIGTTNQGLILIYTWKNEALLFGSLTREQARQEAIEQVAEIHPEINEQDEVEKCIVHAWYNHPSYQGAYGLLKTTQFNSIRYESVAASLSNASELCITFGFYSVSGPINFVILSKLRRNWGWGA
jgi:monoamine oxidase